jgi:NAD+ synthase
MKIYLAQINNSVGDLGGNAAKILREFERANQLGCDLVVFGEMTICGYDCQDLWQKKYFIDAAQEKILEIAAATKGKKCAILLGAPTCEINRAKKEIFYNSAILIADGEIKKIIHKKTLANHGVFDEKRYFESANALSLIEFGGLTLAILICEDLWDAKNLFLLQEQILDGVIVLNASPYSTNKHLARQKIGQNFVKNLNKPLVYVNQVGAQDALVFDGGSFVMNEKGEEILRLGEFVEDFGVVEIEKSGEITTKNPATIFSSQEARDYSACVLGLREYIQKNGFKKVLLGMSGGIDSALVATIAVDALGASNVALYALPSRYNSETSMTDALNCAKNLGVKLEVISIEKPFEAMLSTLGEISQLAQENLQARIRGNILMALSNNSGALLLSTGNKSELACGYATLYGDMCGAFNPIKDLYKTRVWQLAKWRNENLCEIGLLKQKDLIPSNIITKAPTAELRDNQKDSDSLPEYEILDQILFALIEERKSVEQIIDAGFEEVVAKKIAQIFYASQYKRQQSCLGVKISEMSFDLDWRYPVTNKFTRTSPIPCQFKS